MSEEQDRRQLMLDDYGTWLKRTYHHDGGILPAALDHYLWMKEAYGAGDKRGQTTMKGAILDMVEALRDRNPAMQKLYQEIEALE